MTIPIHREAASHVYDTDFFAWLDRNAQVSARLIIALLTKQIQIGSVLDVGCGRGMWLAEWLSFGIKDVFGADGDYVDQTKLLIPPELFHPCDLNKPLRFDRKFDLVQSLEVAEHLSEINAEEHVDSLVRHSDVILFSAATPGQGGEFHINEQPPAYWRAKFEKRGYYPYDYVRPRIKDEEEVGYWYRFNSILYATKSASDKFSAELLSSAVPSSEPIANVAPLIWRLRSQFLRRLPVEVVTKMSRMRYQATNLFHRTR